MLKFANRDIWHSIKKRWRRGFSMVELLIVIAIMIVLAAIALGVGSAAKDSANRASVNSDLRSYQLAAQQLFIQYPEVVKLDPSKDPNAVTKIIEYLNAQMDDDWGFTPAATPNSGNGGVAGTTIKRDAWGNPYGLYIYFNNKSGTYNDATGVPLDSSDTCIYIVVTSSGKNGTGGAVGYNGTNYDPTTGQITSASAMVNNSDGVDDIGIIVRCLNGEVRIATFGMKEAILGALEDLQWIFGVPDATGGICYDFKANGQKSAVTAGSIDQYFDTDSIMGITGGVVGSWS